MSNKLTLEHIAGHLPYGLKVQSELGDIYKVSVGGEPLVNITFIDEVLDNQDKPLFRRLDLTKTIIVEGKEVIPIVELANIAFPSTDWVEYPSRFNTVISNDKKYFQFDCNTFIAWQDLNSRHVWQQKLLFQWLYKNHYDLDGLIDLNLAIDVDTLEVNPYNS